MVHFELIEDRGDAVVLKCKSCNTTFYSSPCGEDNVEWDKEKGCLYSVCPNGCNLASGVRSE
jgi:hypothetical protein